MAQKDALFGEVEQRLVHLGILPEARRAVMALVQAGMETEGGGGDAAGARFHVLIAQTFYKTALRATEELGSSSISMLIMLFDLFVAAEQNRPISVSSLCIASGAAPTTALRQIGQLEARGFIERREDAQDRRRCWVCPTPRAMDLIRSLMGEWTAALCN